MAAKQSSASLSCSNCGKSDVPLLACSRCQLVRYCGKVCQARHWKEGGHKSSCCKSQAGTSPVPTPPPDWVCHLCSEGLSEAALAACPSGHISHSQCQKAFSEYCGDPTNCALCHEVRVSLVDTKALNAFQIREVDRCCSQSGKVPRTKSINCRLYTARQPRSRPRRST